MQYPGTLPPEGQALLDTILIESTLLRTVCPKCKKHYVHHLRKANEKGRWPSSAIEGLRFMVEVHNFTNRYANKQATEAAALRGHPQPQLKPEKYTVGDALRRMHVANLSDAIRTAKVRMAREGATNVALRYDRDSFDGETRGPDRMATAGNRIRSGEEPSELVGAGTASGTPEGAAPAGRFVLVIIATILVATAATVAMAGAYAIMRPRPVVRRSGSEFRVPPPDAVPAQLMEGVEGAA